MQLLYTWMRVSRKAEIFIYETFRRKLPSPLHLSVPCAFPARAYMYIGKRPQSGCKRLKMSIGTNAKEITRERSDQRPWERFFTFSRGSNRGCLSGKVTFEQYLPWVSFPPLAIMGFTWSRSRIGERLRCGCPVSGPRRPREETRPEPIGRLSDTSERAVVWRGLCLVWSAGSQSAGTILQISSSVRSSGILTRVGRMLIFSFSSSICCSSSLPSGPIPPLHFSLSPQLLPLPLTSCPPQVAPRA